MKRNSDFLYIELASILRTQILSGFIKPGEYLLSEHDLCRKYGMSRISVRKSLNELLGEGLIMKLPGKGTIVPPDLVIPEEEHPVLVIVTPFPSTFANKALPELIKLFQARYPGVQFKIMSVPSKTSHSFEEVRGLGIEADLLIIVDSMFPRLQLDHFYPLNEHIEVNKHIPHPLTNVFTHQQQLYAAPLTYSPVYLAYNPELFARYGVELPKPSWSLDDLVVAARKLTRDNDGDGLIDSYGMALSSSYVRWLAFAMKQGVRFGAEGQGEFDSERLTGFLSFIQNLIYRDKVCPIYALNNHEFAQQLFEDGRAGMLLTTTLAFSSKDSSFLPKAAPFPGGGQKGGLLIANGMLMSRSSPNTELAKMFIQFTLEPEVQLRLSETTGLLSIYNDINRRTRDADELDALGLADDGIDRYRFMHELFEDIDVLDDIDEEMKMYWAGMELPVAVVNKLRKIIFDRE